MIKELQQIQKNIEKNRWVVNAKETSPVPADEKQRLWPLVSKVTNWAITLVPILVLVGGAVGMRVANADAALDTVRGWNAMLGFSVIMGVSWFVARVSEGVLEHWGRDKAWKMLQSWKDRCDQKYWSELKKRITAWNVVLGSEVRVDDMEGFDFKNYSSIQNALDFQKYRGRELVARQKWHEVQQWGYGILAQIQQELCSKPQAPEIEAWMKAHGIESLEVFAQKLAQLTNEELCIFIAQGRWLIQRQQQAQQVHDRLVENKRILLGDPQTNVENANVPQYRQKDHRSELTGLKG